MNPVDKFLAVVFAVIVLVLAAALQTGPDDIEAAQDIDADVGAAMLLMAEQEACHELRGPDAQVYLLDNQHLVCRAAAVTTVGVKP